MEKIKVKICELADELRKMSIEQQDDMIEGVAYAHSAFAHTVIAAYNDCEYKLALLLRAS